MPAIAGRRSSRRSASRSASSISPAPSRWATRSAFELRLAAGQRRAAGLRPRVLHQLRLGVGRDRAQDRARLSPRPRATRRRSRLIGRERGYHGVNFGGISVGGIANNRKMVRHAADRRRPYPPHPRSRPQRLHPRRAGAWRRARRRSRAPRRAARRLDHRRRHRRAGRRLDRRADPAQGLSASGSRAICDKHGILLIFDEVITGFGRLGTPFAADYFGVSPDIITTAKGITNGVIPMGAVFVKSEDPRRLHDRPRAADRVLPRLHLFGPPGRLRRLPRHARHLQGGGAADPRVRACAAIGRTRCTR